MISGLSIKAYRKCLLRSSMLNFMYTPQGLQSMGFVSSIIPGLRELHKDDAAFAQSCARYSSYFNCNLVWAPFLAGAFLGLERDIANGLILPDFVAPLKDTTLNTLSAVGDSFFSGSLSISGLLILVCLILMGSYPLAITLLFIWLALSVIFKMILFNIGLARGLSVLNIVRRLNLVNKGDYLKLLNAILLATILAVAANITPEMAFSPMGIKKVAELWIYPIVMLFVMGYAVSRMQISRTLIIIALAVII